MSKEGSNSVENNGTDQAFHQMGKSGHCQSDPRKLPLKKRFRATFENGGLNVKKEAKTYQSNFIPNQEEKMKIVHILPGYKIIRYSMITVISIIPFLK